MKTIKCAPNYTIDEFGNVRNQEGLILKPRNVGYVGASNDSMYKQYRLRVDGKYITRYQHRLLAETFIPNPDNLPVVDHIDGNKGNNSLDNLEWVSRSENTKRALGGGHVFLTCEYKRGITDRLGERVTTIPKGSRVKRPEAQGISKR